MSHLTKPWVTMTPDEKIDAMLHLLIKAADHLPGGKVQELQKWIAIHVEEKNLLRQEIYNLKAELANEKRRSAFYKNTGDKYREQLAGYMGQKTKSKFQTI